MWGPNWSPSYNYWCHGISNWLMRWGICEYLAILLLLMLFESHLCCTWFDCNGITFTFLSSLLLSLRPSSKHHSSSKPNRISSFLSVWHFLVLSLLYSVDILHSMASEALSPSSHSAWRQLKNTKKVSYNALYSVHNAWTAASLLHFCTYSQLLLNIIILKILALDPYSVC